MKSFLFNPSVGMLYFAPLVLLFPKNLKVLKKMFDLIIIFGISYIAIDLLAVRDLLNPVRSSLESVEVVETFANLSLASGFMLLTYGYHSKKRQLFSLGIMVICLLLAIIRARRGLILMNGEILFFSYVLHLIDSKLKLLIIYISILLGLLAMIYINGIYKPEDSRLFGFIVDRGTEDTRSGVELYFYNDMKTNDWIRGKGIDGEYFCPNIEEDQKTNYRSVIETGYLQTILKGGIISLGLFLIIAIPAIIRGIFYSKNMLSKAAGIWILMSLINMYPATVNAFTFPYLLVWISIGICYSKKLRDLPEDFLKKYFRGIT
ncbi:MAG: hypothetical protein Q8891_03750 [Bacteroidota bacterium]|nr:hypothetical protein [Bacteroidota bacterium]